MNNNKRIIFFLFLASLFISCSNGPLKHSSSFEFYPDSNNAIIDEFYYVPQELRYNLKDINKQINWHSSQSLGNQQLLIIPIQLSDGPKFTSEMIDNLQEVFFSNNPQNCYESVKSFFYKSSYGQLTLDGEIFTPFESKYSSISLNIKGQSAAFAIIEEILTTKNFLSEAQRSAFDLDHDKFIDNTILIYSNDYAENATGAFWAWSDYYIPKKKSDKTLINNFMWSSYQFINNKYSDGYDEYSLDSHTFIHETGHLLGLDDYYSYDDTDVWNPSGVIDMQAYNIGDHNVFSKVLLGWIKPIVITSSCIINLKTSANYPEAILLKKGWNGSMFDEYILIEYYTPQNLNYLDSIHRYENDYMFQKSGLRIYHVDARIVCLEENIVGKYQPLYYTDFINEDDEYTYYIGASNSICNSYLNAPYNKKFRLLHLLDQGQNNTINGQLDYENTLWEKHHKFNSHMNFFINENKFNDGTSIGYEIEVIDTSTIEAKIKIDIS